MKAVFSTLIYTNLFSYPLKKEEVWRFLIGKKKNQKQVTNDLKKLKRKGLVEEKAGYFFLKNRKGLVSKRKINEQEAAKKIKKIKKLLPILKRLPFLKAIALTGGVACANAREEDDIDLLIITQENRLWLMRLLLVLFLEAFGLRRRPQDKAVRDKICLNLFLDETVLSIPEKKRNLFAAFEISNIKFLWQRDDTKERFFGANKWVEKYLPNTIPNFKVQMSNQCQSSNDQKNCLNCLIVKLLNCLNCLFYELQLFYMKKHKTKEKIGLHFAFFHPEDKAGKVLKQFSKIDKSL